MNDSPSTSRTRGRLERQSELMRTYSLHLSVSAPSKPQLTLLMLSSSFSRLMANQRCSK